MNLVSLFLILFSFSLFAADDEASKEMHRISDANHERRQKEADDFRKNHPNWSTSIDYLAFEIKQEKDEFNSDLEMHKNLCQRFNSYCYKNEDLREKERELAYKIERNKLTYQLLSKVRSNKMTDKEKDRLIDVFRIQYLSKECSEFKQLCTLVTKDLSEYKKNYGKDYDPTESIKIEPMSFDNQDNDRAGKEIIKNPVHDPRNYKPESCVWAEDLPRRIVEGPGCNKTGNRLCVGFVVCEQKTGGAKFVRMSTCSSENCGDGAAVACTKQLGYGSRRPEDETKATVSDPIKDILTNKSSQQ